MKYILLFISFSLLASAVQAQEVSDADFILEKSNIRHRVIAISIDTIRLDTVSIVFESLVVSKMNGEIIPKENYYIDEIRSFFYCTLYDKVDSLILDYRILPIDLSAAYSHKDKRIIQSNIMDENPFAYKITKDNKFNIFEESTLQRNGSISRGMVLGNRQNLSINSNFNLQLSGKLSNEISILANISDDNIPIQAEGNTQQLQEFDNIFIKIYNDRSSLVAGDFRMNYEQGRFLKYAKKSRGVEYQYVNSDYRMADSLRSKSEIGYKINASAAISKGKFARNSFRGIEGNQGPYRLHGAENETFIIVLSGTERVFIDGKLLRRGENNDYKIDYNAAEITFTSNILMTKDRRVNVEFQYSDKNYARSIVTVNSVLKRRKSSLSIGVYSEQDSKNQTLQQDLSDNDRELLSSVGDNLNNAVIESIDTVVFSDAQVLYLMIDSLGYDSVFVFGAHPDSTNFSLSFSFVGPNGGDYVQEGFTPNGRKYKWVAPEVSNGQIIHQGEYHPVRRLVSPKKRQVVSIRHDIADNTGGNIYTEVSISNYDKNTFSAVDDNNNTGFGVNVGMAKFLKLNDLTRLKFSLDHEFVEENYQAIERYREVEFDINWNYRKPLLQLNQHISSIGIGLFKNDSKHVLWKGRSLIEKNRYQGIRNELDIKWGGKRTQLRTNASWLTTHGVEQTQFFMQKLDLSRDFSGIRIGVKDEFRSNKKFVANGDSLAGNSFEFIDGEIYLTNKDSSKTNFRLFYNERLDKGSDLLTLQEVSKSRMFGVKFKSKLNKNHFLDVVVTNRSLRIIEEELTIQDAEDSFLGKLNYRGSALKKGFIFSTYYDINSGLEPKREFVYIQVPPGQGVYIWVDYNENDVKELDEFEVAAFQYEADYIRTFTLTNDFQKTYANSFGQSFEINPSVWWSESKGVLKMLNRFSNITSVSISRKTTREDRQTAFNPFIKSINDSSLIHINSSLREVIFFNKKSLNWGLDYTFSDRSNKQLLSNGFEAKRNRQQKINVRWNITKQYRLDQYVEQGTKQSLADYSIGRNYFINSQALGTSLQFQPGKKYRVKIKSKFINKENESINETVENEKANIQSLGFEGRYSEVGKGNIQLNFEYINIQYVGQSNSALAFEMLDGLAKGVNYTWSLLLQHSLMKNLELNVTYNGRKSDGINTIHTGGMQIRAIF